MRLFSKQNSAGFSLVEMMVVIAIFFIITAVILGNLPDFQNKTSMDLVAQDVALTIRTAQVYSTATKKSQVDSTNQFPSYGIHFDTSPDKKTKLILYSGGPNDVLLGSKGAEPPSPYSLEGKTYVKSIFGDNDVRHQFADIFFLRPNTEAILTLPGNIKPNSITIVLSNLKKDEERYVTVYKNGQIKVSKPDNLNP